MYLKFFIIPTFCCVLGGLTVGKQGLLKTYCDQNFIRSKYEKGKSISFWKGRKI